MVRESIRNVVKSAGGWEQFLVWCENTQTDALSTFDITDEEWAELKKENA